MRFGDAPGEKGNLWYFGERFRIGVDAGTGYIHSVEITAANAGEREVVLLLIREDDRVSVVMQEIFSTWHSPGVHGILTLGQVFPTIILFQLKPANP